MKLSIAHPTLIFSSDPRFIRPDGKITWVYGQAIAETTTNGSVTGYIGTITDITERLKIKVVSREIRANPKLLIFIQYLGTLRYKAKEVLVFQNQ